MFRLFYRSGLRCFREKGNKFIISSIFMLTQITMLLQTTMQRHRMIYSALADDFAQGLHALSLKTKTEAEVAAALSSTMASQNTA